MYQAGICLFISHCTVYGFATVYFDDESSRALQTVSNRKMPLVSSGQASRDGCCMVLHTSCCYVERLQPSRWRVFPTRTTCGKHAQQSHPSFFVAHLHHSTPPSTLSIPMVLCCTGLPTILSWATLPSQIHPFLRLCRDSDMSHLQPQHAHLSLSVRRAPTCRARPSTGCIPGQRFRVFGIPCFRHPLHGRRPRTQQGGGRCQSGRVASSSKEINGYRYNLLPLVVHLSIGEVLPYQNKATNNGVEQCCSRRTIVS